MNRSDRIRSMTIEKAERRGYVACSRCSPDCRTGKYESPQQRTENAQRKKAEATSPAKDVKESNNNALYDLLAPWLAFLFLVYLLAGALLSEYDRYGENSLAYTLFQVIQFLFLLFSAAFNFLKEKLTRKK